VPNEKGWWQRSSNRQDVEGPVGQGAARRWVAPPTRWSAGLLVSPSCPESVNMDFRGLAPALRLLCAGRDP
jgi:hypothetical protein